MRERIDRLERFPVVVAGLCGPLTSVQARWRARPPKEERCDFRVRIERTLRDPLDAWPPIDPQAWVREHDDQSQDLRDVLRRFARERASSLFWLRDLPSPDWNAAHEHPKLGRLRAGDLLAAWCAHDALHLKQLARWTYERTLADAAPWT